MNRGDELLFLLERVWTGKLGPISAMEEIKALLKTGVCNDCDYLDTFNDDYDGKFFCRLESCPVDQIYDDQIYVFGCNDFQRKESE